MRNEKNLGEITLGLYVLYFLANLAYMSFNLFNRELYATNTFRRIVEYVKVYAIKDIFIVTNIVIFIMIIFSISRAIKRNKIKSSLEYEFIALFVYSLYYIGMQIYFILNISRIIYYEIYLYGGDISGINITLLSLSQIINLGTVVLNAVIVFSTLDVIQKYTKKGKEAAIEKYNKVKVRDNVIVCVVVASVFILNLMDIFAIELVLRFVTTTLMVVAHLYMKKWVVYGESEEII